MVLKKLFTVDPATNGKGRVYTAWSKDSTLLAVVGEQRKINIFDRQGKTVASANLPVSNAPLGIDWSPSGSIVSVMQDKASTVAFFYPGSRKMESFETGLKDLTVMKWARTADILLCGNNKGGAVLYHADTTRKIPITGRHNKKIVSVGWGSYKNWFSLTSDDNAITVNDGNTGDQIDRCVVKGVASDVCISSKKTDNRGGSQDTTLSMLHNKKTLLLYQILARESLLELTFNPRYGELVSHSWYGDGYLVMGFSSGQVSILSSHQKEIGAEISTLKSHKDELAAMIVNKAISRGASVGNGRLRVFDLEGLQLSDAKSETFDFEGEAGQLNELNWTDDGQIITVSSLSGTVYAFMTRLPSLCVGNSSRILYMSSLSELSVRDVAADAELSRIPIEVEPSFAALSDSTAGVGMNNMVSFFSYEVDAASRASDPEKKSKPKKGKLICSKQYPTVVDDLKISRDYAAALSNGKVTLSTFDGSKTRQFPERNDAGNIVSHALTNNFYLYATSNGYFVMFSLQDFQQVCEYKHSHPIRSIWPNTEGTRSVIIDHNNAAHVFNPVTEITCTVEGATGAMEKFLFDATDPSCIIGVDSANFTTYIYSHTTRFGPTCTFFRKSAKGDKPLQTARPLAFVPANVVRGVVFGQSASGTISTIELQSHLVPGPNAPQQEQFKFYLQMNRLEEALALAATPEMKKELADRALHLLNVNFAVRVFRGLNVPTTVMALERIMHVQEKNLLMGHICAMFKQFNEAQNFFKHSSSPYLALEMRRDLLHWDQALALAQELAEDQVPALSKECAQQYEFRGEWNQAKEHYVRGVVALPKIREEDATSLAAFHNAQQQNDVSRAGAARCLFRMGNIREGMKLLNELSARASPEIFDSCAAILHEMRQFEEAAKMYEKANKYDDAAAIYIRDTKQMRMAQQILGKVQSRNVLMLYAQAKEEDSQYQDAATAYDRAEDWDNAVRIRVEYLNDLPGAYRIVRLTRSAEAAGMVANVCKRRHEFSAAIEFLLLARSTKEAFQLARDQGIMSAFETSLLQQVQLVDGVAPQARHLDFRMVAEYYDTQDKPGLAGDYFLIGAEYEKALERFCKVNTEESIEKAIDVVARAKSDRLTATFIDYLQGASNGEPKDPKYFFKLHMALKNYDKVAKTALIISNKEQEIGNYRAAHRMLVDTILLLQKRGIRIASELRRALMLVHSYIIVRHLIKPLDEPQTATRMLLRVARNITKFPKHEAAILATTVVECAKNDFKKSSYEFACNLVQSEKLRKEMPEKSGKKVDAIVRKRGKEELADPIEHTSLCPFCSNPIEETALDCPACQNHLPICIVTGKHMTLDEWTECPNCQFPALLGPFQKLLQFEPQCPLCGEKVESYLIEKMVNVDPKKYV